MPHADSGPCLRHAALLGPSSSRSKKPNIIYVLFDDMGYGEPKCYRAETKLKTPNIDRLAAEGMRFTDAHTASSVCTPTRYGQLLDALEKKGLAGNTLVIATADNGAAGRAYPPLRASKSSIYEGGHRVPFLARWPGRIKPGSVSDQAICLNDLIATSAEIIGVKLPDNAGEDSVSILPALLGTAKEPLREATIHQAPNRDIAIRQGRWKLIFSNNGERELLDLQADPGETGNLAGTNPEVVERLTTLMKKYIAQGRSTAGASQKNEASVSIEKTTSSKRKKNRKQ